MHLDPEMINDNIPTDKVDLNHHLQRQILVKLRQSGPSTYRQLKPDGVEGNAYNYHLRSLKKADLLARENDQYTLTATGYLVVDAFSLHNQRLMLRPHLYTVLLVTSGEYVLLYRHARSPLEGSFSLLSGKLHYGDEFDASIAREASRRELSDDYKAMALCPYNVRYVKDQKVLLHRSGILWHLEYMGPRVSRQTANGSSVWIKQDELTDMSGCLPEVLEGMQRIDGKNQTPIDISCQI